MKITVDVDCTPEEARRFMGLPDLTPVHDAYIGRLVETVSSGSVPTDLIEGIVRSWAPMGEAGLRMWQQLLERAGGAAKG